MKNNGISTSYFIVVLKKISSIWHQHQPFYIKMSEIIKFWIHNVWNLSHYFGVNIVACLWFQHLCNRTSSHRYLFMKNIKQNPNKINFHLSYFCSSSKHQHFQMVLCKKKCQISSRRKIYGRCLSHKGGWRYLEKKTDIWAGEMFQWLRTLVVILEGPSSLPNTHVSCLQLQVQESPDLFWPSGHLHTWSEH